MKIKNPLIIFFFSLLMISFIEGCSNSDELNFECKITDAGYGTKANITFNKANNSATVVTDLMNGPMLTHKADPSLTADKLIVKFYPKTLEGWVADYPSTLNVNRDTLKMTGSRNGTCKMVKKRSNSKF